MTTRKDRADSVLQRNISDIISHSLSDPRLSGTLVGVSRVDISSDLKYAKVFLSVLPQSARDDVLSAVSGATGFIKRELASKIKFRALPELHFFLDTSEDYSQKINSMINDISYANPDNYNDENYEDK